MPIHRSRTRQRGLRHAGLALAAATAAATLLAACSSSGTPASTGASDTSGTPGTSTAATPTGTPINIGYIGDMSGTAASTTDYYDAGVVATEAVNAAGGIHGHPLNLVSCDTHGDPTTSLSCARKLVDDDKIVALVGGDGEDGVADVLTAGNVVDWMAVGDYPEDVNNPLVYETALNTVSVTDSVYLGIKKFNPTNFAFLTIQGAGAELGEAQKVAARYGVKLNIIEVPEDTTDFSAYIQKIKDSGAQVWGTLLLPQQLAPAIQAASNGGLNLPLAMSDITMTPAAIEAISQAPFPNVIALEKLEDPTMSKTWATYLAQLKQFDPDGTKVTDPSNGNDTNMWFGVYTFAAIAKELPEVTPKAFADKVATISDFNYDWMHPLDFTKPGPIPGLKTQYNVWAYQGTYKDGKTVVLSKTPFSAYENSAITPYKS